MRKNLQLTITFCFIILNLSAQKTNELNDKVNEHTYMRNESHTVKRKIELQFEDYKYLKKIKESQEKILEIKGDKTFVPESDSLALVALYNATGGDSWTDNSNWLTGEVNSWYGITVSGGSVVEVYFSNNNLVGSIPSELGNLSNLEQLILGGSGLTGSIPSELGNLSNLFNLSLANTNLSGSIPSELGNLSNLIWLTLSYNNLSGSIPAELGNLSNLNSLNLRYNNLTGPIPSELGNLNLSWMYLNDNNLSGPIPKELGNLSNLQSLYLEDNELTNSIPSELGNLSNLESLFLYKNKLTGPIPSELGSLSNLQELILSWNDLTGSIPAEFGNLSNLSDLTLYGNNLIGSVPTEIGSLVNLEYLILAGNQLTSLPDLSSLNKLAYLTLYENHFTFEDFDDTKLDFSSIYYLDYAPQLNMELANQYLYYSEESSVTLNCSNLTSSYLTSETNQYLMYKDGIMIKDWSTDPEYNIPSFAIENTGEYYIQVKNSVYPDLILYSDTITIDFNNSPTDIELSNDSINENLTSGSLIGLFSSTDDFEDTHTYSLITGDGTNDVDNSSFTIKNDSLFNAVEFDYESQPEYYIYVQTEDKEGLTYNKAFVVYIQDINDTPTDIELSNYSIDENSSIGSLIGLFSTTDDDSEDVHTYSFATGDGNNDASNSSFIIKNDSLFTAIEPDYESQSEYYIHVQTEDNGGLTYTESFVIIVNDLTETGINKQLNNSFVIYPNPSTGEFYLEINTNISEYTVSIYNIIGNKVFEQVFNNKATYISTGNLPSGTYIMQLKTGDTVKSKQIIMK